MHLISGIGMRLDMAWSAKHDTKTNIIELVYTDTLSTTDVREAIAKRISLQKKTGSLRVLADISLINHSKMSVLDILLIPAEYLKAIGSDRCTRTAIILPQEPRGRLDAHFYQTVCMNRGWCIKVFDTRHEALEWLSG